MLHHGVHRRVRARYGQEKALPGAYFIEDGELVEIEDLRGKRVVI